MTDDEMIESMARAICKFQNRDPDIMTYINDAGEQRPYGPAWNWFINETNAALAAIRPEIDRRIAEARNAALEEAAMIIETSGRDGYGDSGKIRALKS
jgi:hypothetical protein